MGGEWGVGASLAMKSADEIAGHALRIASGGLRCWLSPGYRLLFLCISALGWRPLFFIGGLPALPRYSFAQSQESEVWKKTRHDSWGQLGRSIVRTGSFSSI